MNHIIDQITATLAHLSAWMSADSGPTEFDRQAQEHLVQARRLLIAKYQPHTGPRES